MTPSCTTHQQPTIYIYIYIFFKERGGKRGELERKREREIGDNTRAYLNFSQNNEDRG